MNAKLAQFRLNYSIMLCLQAALFLLPGLTMAQNAYFQHNLVSDLPGTADITDTNLVNPWGIAFSASSPFWVANDLSGVSTLYNGSGTPQSLVVTIPPGSSPAKPTGIVFNGSTNFTVASNAPAHFIFDTEGGTIAGWNSGTSAVIKVDNSATGAVYKGLAIGTSGGSNYLYAANFHSGAVEVYDGNYNPATLAGSFSDPSIPTNFAPFNIQSLGGMLYVAYAKQDAQRSNDVAGGGNGYVNIFDTSGNFVKRFASSNVLNSPWGLAIAPTNFGAFSGALLVGNFGNGRINAFDPATGAFLGTMHDAAGNDIRNFGLWAIVAGNGGNGGDTRTLYFDAGIPGPAPDFLTHGLFGSISAIAPTFTNTTDKGTAVALSWVSGAAPFLLQKKVSLLDTNWVDLLTTTNRNLLVTKDSDSEFFRLQGLATNTVLPFTALLNGASEVPTVNAPGTGVGTFSLEGSNLSYYISFSGLTGPANGAHLHAAANPTNAANVMVALSPPPATSGTMSGTLVLTQEQITNIVNGLCYVNIHTPLNGNGEIRGQLVPLHMVVTLNQASEVPAVTNAPNAVALGSLTFIGSQLFYSVTYSGLSATGTLAHIHGPAGPSATASPIIPLPTPTGTSGNISGTTNLTPTQLAYVLSGLTYINIHTTNNPSGEIRGQIWPIQFGARLNAVSEVPSTTSPGTGSGSMNILNNVLSYSFSFTNLLSAANSGHIHGPATSSQTANPLISFTVPAVTGGSFSGTAALTPEQLFYFISGLTYANIHTTNNPNGEIRGQIIPNN